MKARCATCSKEFTFEDNWICPECDEKIRDAKRSGADAIAAILKFQRKEIGFGELKRVMALAGITYNSGESE